MSELPVAETFEDIAIELGVDPSFVEKDWYAVLVLKTVSLLSEHPIIFTGGTSLSKAYGLIERFSEDLDFRIYSPEEKFTRGKRKKTRESILTELRRIAEVTVDEDSIKKLNESKFFSLNLSYPQLFSPTDALRPSLKLEFSFEETLIVPEEKDIWSFVSQFTESEKDCTIKTISPVETAANKFSALLWRINIKDRTAEEGTPQNDPTMMRHVHDLTALESVIMSDTTFKDMVKASFEERDRGRGGSEKDKDLEELAQEALVQLKEDSVYEHEYRQFVDSMSYAAEDETLTFDKGVQAFERIVAFLLEEENGDD